MNCMVWYMDGLQRTGCEAARLGGCCCVNLTWCLKCQIWWVDTNDPKKGQMKQRINGKGLLLIRWGYPREESFLSRWLSNGMGNRFRKRNCFLSTGIIHIKMSHQKGGKSDWSLERAELKFLVVFLYESIEHIIFLLCMVYIRKLRASSDF